MPVRAITTLPSNVASHVRWTSDIDPSCKNDVGDVLKSALSDHGKIPVVPELPNRYQWRDR